MVQYKLNYFNFRGRGEVVRLVFAAAGEKFEDNRFEYAQWPEYKQKAPFGQCPWLEIHDGGKVTNLSQSITIARYLARKFGLAGKNDLEAAEIEMYGDQATDLQNEIFAIHFEKDEARKKALEAKLAESLPRNVKLFEERLAKSTSGFIANSGISWADLHLYNVLEFLGDRLEPLLANFKHVKAMTDKVRAHPNVATWLASRPKSEY